MIEISIKKIIEGKEIKFNFNWTEEDQKEWNKIMKDYHIQRAKMFRNLKEGRDKCFGLFC